MLNKVIKMDSEKFPDFLSSKITTHMEAMGCLFDIFRAVLSINLPQFLDEEVLFNTATFINNRFLHIQDVLDFTTYIKCVDYFRFRLFLYIDNNLKYEKYEEVYNMQEIALFVFNKRFKHIIDEEDYEDTL